MDRQFDDALVLIRDAAEGLTKRLGPYHPDTALAQRLLDWIEDLADQGG
jgi:hypothetical protein